MRTGGGSGCSPAAGVVTGAAGAGGNTTGVGCGRAQWSAGSGATGCGVDGVGPTTGIAGVGVTGEGVSIGGRSAVGEGRSIASSSANTTSPPAAMTPRDREGATLAARTSPPATHSRRALPAQREARSTRCSRSAAHPLALLVRASQPIRGRFPGQASLAPGCSQSEHPARDRAQGLTLHYFPLWSWMITSASNGPAPGRPMPAHCASTAVPTL